jgi:putative flippase GtrA
VLLFTVLHNAVGAQCANLLALLIGTVANTAANRRFTFGVRGRDHVARHHYEGFIVFGIALAITSGALAALHAVTSPSHAVELMVLVAANLAAVVVRFSLLRSWVFHPDRSR